jgi:hypothetical protein
MGNQGRYQRWLAQRFINSAESELSISDIVGK